MAPTLPPDPQLWGLSVLDLQDMFTRSLASLVTLFFALSALPGLALPSIKDARAADPCAAIAGRKWVAPSDVRACFTSFQVDPAEKTNVGDHYSFPYLLSVLTSSPIIRLSQLPLGSSTSTHPSTTRSRPPNRSLTTSMKISSSTSSGSTGLNTRTTSNSTSTFRVLSRG